MTIVLIHPISLHVVKEDGSAFVCIQKTVNSNLRPVAGDMIEDAAFRGYPVNSEVVKVILDYSTNTCYVSIRVFEIESEDSEELNKYVAQAEKCGWEKAPRPRWMPDKDGN